MGFIQYTYCRVCFQLLNTKWSEQVTFTEKPQKKINLIDAQTHEFLIHTWSDKALLGSVVNWALHAPNLKVALSEPVLFMHFVVLPSVQSTQLVSCNITLHLHTCRKCNLTVSKYSCLFMSWCHGEMFQIIIA